MEIFRNRPLALFGTVLAAIAAVSVRVSGDKKLAWLIAFGVIWIVFMLVHLLIRRSREWTRYLVAAVLGGIVALSTSYIYFDCYLADRQENVGKETVITGTVLDRGGTTSFSSVFYVELDGEARGERVVLECEYPSALQAGDRFTATVFQRAFENTAQYNEESYYLADGYTGIFVCTSYKNCVKTGNSDFDLRIWLSSINETISVKLIDALGEREGGLIAAILLGNRSYLSETTELAFRRTGVSHLLALSGLHVSILIGFLEMILRKLRIGRMIRAFAVPAVLVGYLGITGCSVSATRAVLMVCLLYLGFLLRADYDSFTALCVILALLLTFTPYAVLDLSLWLSFIAAASIIIFYPMIKKIGQAIQGNKSRPFIVRRWIASLFEAIMIGVVASAAVMLISAVVFEESSVLSIPTTILLSAPLSLLMILSILLLPLMGVSFLTYPCRILSRGMLESIEWLSNWEGILFSMNSGYETLALLVLTGYLIFLAIWRIKHATMILLVPLLILLLYGTSYAVTSYASRTYTFACEQTGGFAALSEGGKMIAVDQDAIFASDARLMSDYAREHRCAEITDLCIAKYDNRRSYLLRALAERIKIRRVRLPRPANERERAIADRIAEEAVYLGIEVRYDVLELPISNAGDPYLWYRYPPKTE